jgi:hypothetical protein
MSFPSSPTNGQQATVNNTTYVYNSAQNTWSVVATTPNFSNLSVTGNITSGNLSTTNSAVANAYYSNYYLYSNGATITTPAGGSNTMVQFNDNGSFSGATYLQYNKTSGNLVSNSTTTATSTTTGALVVSGGVGIGGNLFVGGNLSIAGNTTFINTQTITTTDTIAAPTINAGTIGNSGATFSGSSGTLTGLFTASNLNLSLTTASTVTAVLTRGSDNNFQLTAQNGTASNATGAETARFGINYSGSGWDSFIQFIRGSSSQNGALGLWAANTAVANVASTAIYPVSNNSITLGTASGQYFSATYANNYYGTNFNGSSIFGTIIGNTASAINGNIHTGSAVYAGTIGNTGTTLTGTLSTAAQTNITSVGTLTGLTVSGTTNLQGTTNGATINASSLLATTIGNASSSITGTLQTAAQTNITSVGTLTGLTLSGAINGQTINGTSILGTTIGNTASAVNGNIHTGSAVYAGTIGNTGTTLTGTLSTAAQTNITSVGTLSALTVTATITGSVSGNAGTATALQTARNINGVSFNGTADITVHTAGTGISVSGTTITNTGVTSAVAGTGISVSGATGAVTITNSGVTSAVAGTGISVSGATGAVTITNNGVTSAVAGTGVSVSGSTGAVTFSIGQAVGTGNTPTFAGLTVNGGLTAVAQSFNSNPANTDAGRIFSIYNTNYMPGASYSSGDSRIMDFGVTTGNIAYMRHAGSNGLQWYVGGNGTSFNNALLPTSNASINIGGTGSNYWSTIYAVSFVGTSTTAKYADLAEMYHSDDYYSPGTVMIFGGDLDVTVSTQSHDTAVAGVVSTNPAYLMNDNFENDNWLPIALTGRVPCLVRGPVNKGTLLVSSNESGVACALDKSLYEPGCVIGKSMDIILDNSVRKIEIAVGRF